MTVLEKRRQPTVTSTYGYIHQSPNAQDGSQYSIIASPRNGHAALAKRSRHCEACSAAPSFCEGEGRLARMQMHQRCHARLSRPSWQQCTGRGCRDAETLVLLLHTVEPIAEGEMVRFDVDAGVGKRGRARHSSRKEMPSRRPRNRDSLRYSVDACTNDAASPCWSFGRWTRLDREGGGVCGGILHRLSQLATTPPCVCLDQISLGRFVLSMGIELEVSMRMNSCLHPLSRGEDTFTRSGPSSPESSGRCTLAGNWRLVLPPELLGSMGGSLQTSGRTQYCPDFNKILLLQSWEV